MRVICYSCITITPPSVNFSYLDQSFDTLGFCGDHYVVANQSFGFGLFTGVTETLLMKFAIVLKTLLCIAATRANISNYENK